jgi:hypothetical protein
MLGQAIIPASQLTLVMMGALLEEFAKHIACDQGRDQDQEQTTCNSHVVPHKAVFVSVPESHRKQPLNFYLAFPNKISIEKKGEAQYKTWHTT